MFKYEAVPFFVSAATLTNVLTDCADDEDQTTSIAHLEETVTFPARYPIPAPQCINHVQVAAR